MVVRLNEVFQGQAQERGVLQVATLARSLDVIGNHALDALLTGLRVHQVIAHFESHNFGQMLVLADGQYLVLAKFGQFDACLLYTSRCV